MGGYSAFAARATNLTEFELPALISLARLSLMDCDPAAAHAGLEGVWAPAAEAPYPMHLADAQNLLVEIEIAAGNEVAAIEAATEAYRAAWCDGPPYAYHWGLKAAKAHLKALGAPEPEMPAFDESKFDPMPDIEILPD